MWGVPWRGALAGTVGALFWMIHGVPGQGSLAENFLQARILPCWLMNYTRVAVEEENLLSRIVAVTLGRFDLLGEGK